MVATPQSHPPVTQRRAPVADTAVAGHRRGGGLRHSSLRSVRTQLLAPIIVAMVGLGLLGTIQTSTAISEAADAKRARILANTAVETVQLVHEIDREFAETNALRDRGGSAGLPLVTVQRQATDQYVTSYRAAAEQTSAVSPELAPLIRTADDALINMASARAIFIGGDDVAVATATGTYETVVLALLAVADALPAKVLDPDLSNETRAIAALAAVEHYDSLERSVVRKIFARKTLEPGDLTTLAALIGQRQERFAEFTRTATQAQEDVYTSTVVGDDVETATTLREALLVAETDASILKTDPDTWYTAQSNQIRRINRVSLQLSDQLDETASSVESAARQEAWITAVGTVGLGLLALGAASRSPCGLADAFAG